MNMKKIPIIGAIPPLNTIMGNHGVAGVSENAGVLVVLILPWDPFY